MKESIVVIAVFAAALASPAAFASKELAEKKQCLSCHSVDQHSVFPAYKKIAEKYAGDKDAAARLVQTAMKGTRDKPVWGNVPMPPPAVPVSEAEAKQLVQWILSLK